MKAIGMYIFCGSQTIGHMKAGWDIDTILEMTDDMLDGNAYHFHKNYPNIDIKLPNEYENNESYLQELKNNPQVTMLSRVAVSKTGRISGIEQPVVKTGHPFILVSFNKDLNNDNKIINQFIR